MHAAILPITLFAAMLIACCLFIHFLPPIRHFHAVARCCLRRADMRVFHTPGDASAAIARGLLRYAPLRYTRSRRLICRFAFDFRQARHARAIDAR